MSRFIKILNVCLPEIVVSKIILLIFYNKVSGIINAVHKNFTDDFYLDTCPLKIYTN